jgi:hypothetical protein
VGRRAPRRRHRRLLRDQTLPHQRARLRLTCGRLGPCATFTWTDPTTSASGVGIDVVDPAIEETIDRVPEGSPDDVDAAVRAAREAPRPLGGTGQSGVGREVGRFGLEEYLEVKALLL